ncbi:MAG TPA: phosphatidate cytidylyltransferase [Candidatus Dojkabacteria bacterium]
MKKKELIRQAVHLVAGIIGVINIRYSIIPIGYVLLIYAAVIVLFIFLNLVVDDPLKIHRIVRVFERKNGMIGQGVVTLFSAYIILHFASFFDDKAFYASLSSMLIVSVGDSASTFFGIFLGGQKLPYNSRKTINGLVGGIISSFLSVLIFINILPALVTTSIAMFAESLDLKILKFRLDDNLLIPTISFILLYLVF